MTKTDLSQLSPSLVWQIFKNISKIPRCSKKEEKIRSWVKNWANKNNIAFKEDKVGNILLTQTATPSFETNPTLVLQGHMDMVCTKEQDLLFNFDADPINVVVDESGEFITAKGTSLGADNGIGMSIALASLVDPELQHGSLEVLLTVDEETGLTGAFEVKPGFFTGKYMLNIDSDTLGAITISSAGGGDTQISLDCQIEQVDNTVGFELIISGLTGGHSGVDIHHGRYNAIQVLTKGLSEIRNEDFQIKEITGGSTHNAIPRNANCKFFVPTSKSETIMQTLTSWLESTQKTISKSEANVSITLNRLPAADTFLSKQTTSTVLDLLLQLPHGPVAYSKDIPNLVETSINLATIKIEDNKARIQLSTRSAKNEELVKARVTLKNIAENLGAEVIQGSAYPGWYSDLKSPFLSLVRQKYEEVLGKDVKLKAIHAGLECGLFTALDPELQIVAIGPNIKGEHSVEEQVEIKSVTILWNVVKSVIEELGELK